MDKLHEKCDEVLRLHPEKKSVYAEKFEDKSFEGMYLEAWDLLKTHMKMNKEEFDRKEACQKKKKSLEDIKRTLKDQIIAGFDENEDNDEVDFRKLYKTIMCPLKNKCSKVRFQRWPSSNIKSFSKFGKECPYAHHPMELQFPQTLTTRINASDFKKLNPNKPIYTGPLYDCGGCSRCNLCKYKLMSQQLMNRPKSAVRSERIDERKKEIDKNDRQFFQKFGMLKKASVLLFYGRVNDSFDEIAKAAQIIKEQKELERENEEKIRRRWRFKLGIESDIELPKPFHKVTLDDLNDDFLSKIDR